MELSPEVSSALQILGDEAKLDRNIFNSIVDISFNDLSTSEKPQQDEQDFLIKDGISKKQLCECHRALMTVAVECARIGIDNILLTNTLEEASWSADRLEHVVKKYDEKLDTIRSQLAAQGTYPPHIVDVDWRLDYHVRSNTSSKEGNAVYRITFFTETAGKQGQLTFTCSHQQLSHLVTKLRQCTRCVEKYAQQ
ncbi:COMM domain-containing protein 3 [Oratosquilla oratoria]|uniref:COMM domain-containing protein 3 n=1 Tax=Oratosquilla oratoria TaxID=337810 RepID=UPI003F75D1F7